MKTILKNIATIQTGLFANDFKNGEIVYLQTKHFNDDGTLKQSLYPDLSRNKIDENHILKNGDVLFAAKGGRNFAIPYINIKYLCVASTSFFVIRIIDENILPEYLSWFLNHPSTLRILKSQAIGTSIPSISKAVLQELELSIPDLKTQKTIVHIADLRKKEKKILLDIESLREHQIQQQIFNALK
jgi:restriction endonuclease S subunit